MARRVASLEARARKAAKAGDKAAAKAVAQEGAALARELARGNVEAGIRRLEALAAAENIPYPFRQGLKAQAVRARELQKEGRLVGVEVEKGKGIGRIDFQLDKPPEIIEYKYWTRTYLEENTAKLASQLKRYLKTGEPLTLELAITRTSPVDAAFIRTSLIAELANLGIVLDPRTIEVGEEMIRVSVRAAQRG